MPVFQLNEGFTFPNPELANEDGIIAIGGDVHPKRLIKSYESGIFPWPHDNYPLLWFSPDPRFILPLSEIHIPKSLKKFMRKDIFEIRFDTAFTEVIKACANSKRPEQRGTWITRDMIVGYSALHQMGFAHSIEAYQNGRLVGGLYGVSLGKVFFGESMFANESNASKVAFVTLLAHLRSWDFEFVDCQAQTEHLERFGARHIPRTEFLHMLKKALTHQTKQGAWEACLTSSQVLKILDI